MIKSEYNDLNRLSSDIYSDADLAKKMTDDLCLISKSELHGYIQEISLNPFGFLLISDIQVIIIIFV